MIYGRKCYSMSARENKINTYTDQVKMSLVFRTNDYSIKIVFLLALVLMLVTPYKQTFSTYPTLPLFLVSIKTYVQLPTSERQN